MAFIDEGSMLAAATAILAVGIAVFLLLFVPYLKEMLSKLLPELVFVILFFVVLGIIVLASWMIYFAQLWPLVLLPVILVTLLFRAAAPYYMWDGMHRKRGGSVLWKRGISFFEFSSFVLVTHSLYSAYALESRDALTFWQDVIMFFTVLYNYGKMYLKFFMPLIKSSKLVLNWVSAFLVSLSFIILVPLLVPEFHFWYRLANASGWIIGLWHLRRLDIKDHGKGKKGKVHR